jgi:hypothetical protein
MRPLRPAQANRQAGRLARDSGETRRAAGRKDVGLAAEDDRGEDRRVAALEAVA